MITVKVKGFKELSNKYSRAASTFKTVLKNFALPNVRRLHSKIIADVFSGPPALTRRTGTFEKSFKTFQKQMASGFSFSVYTQHIAAHAHEFGTTIFPRTRQNLAIPVGAGLSGIGPVFQSPHLDIIYPGRFAVKKSGAGSVLVDTFSPGEPVTHVLKKSQRMPARMGMFKSGREFFDKMKLTLKPFIVRRIFNA